MRLILCRFETSENLCNIILYDPGQDHNLHTLIDENGNVIMAKNDCVMANKDIDQQFTKESILKVINNELAGLNLSTGDYVQVANSILDYALETRNGQDDTNNFSSQKITRLPIVTDELIIRACDPKTDFPIFEQWTRDERGREFLLSRLENNLETASGVLHNPNHRFGMVCDPDMTPIGIVGFLNRDRSQNRAELRKLIGEPDRRGQGLGKKASRLWVNYGLNALKLRKIYLYTFDSNLRNIRINEELGFRLEGVFREEHVIDGQPKDILRMSLIR